MFMYLTDFIFFYTKVWESAYVTHHIKTNQLLSATCSSCLNLVSDVKDGILVVCICKNTIHATSKLGQIPVSFLCGPKPVCS